MGDENETGGEPKKYTWIDSDNGSLSISGDMYYSALHAMRTEDVHGSQTQSANSSLTSYFLEDDTLW